MTTLAVISVTAPSAAAIGLVNSSATACSWREVLSVPGGWLNDVTVADGVVWTVGYQTPRGSNKTYPLVAAWDGERWSTSIGKGFGKNEDVMTAPGGDVWVTGVRNTVRSGRRPFGRSPSPTHRARKLPGWVRVTNSCGSDEAVTRPG
jgi:hypothetical protein